MSATKEGLMTGTLKISDTLALPSDVVTQKLAFLGRTGSGKSYGATKLCELMLDAGAQVIALDPVGVWYGLRLSADGSRGFAVPVFGGEHGDVPLEPKSGALIADIIVDRQISAVLDLSHFILAEQRRFSADFARQLFQRKKTSRSAIHIFLEEAQEFVPQQARGEIAMMLGMFERLIKLGRNYGIGASLISQRPQAVNKDVLNQTECLFAFQMTAPHERKAIEAWVTDKGLEGDIKAILPKLRVGEAHVWSPQWLQISETIRILPKKTLDASSTPKMGAKPIKTKELSPVDVDEIRTAMREIVQRAEENDPKALRKQIAELQREVTRLKQAKPDTTTEIVEVPVFGPQALAQLENLKSYIDDVTTKLIDGIEAVQGVESLISEALKRAKLQPSAAISAAVQSRIQPDQGQGTAHRPCVESRSVNSEVSASQQKILDALALFEQLGISPARRINVAFFAGYTENGHFNNMVGNLRTAGLLDYPQGGYLGLTAEGRAIADAIRARSSLKGTCSTSGIQSSPHRKQRFCKC
jgi:hypothetical protein